MLPNSWSFPVVRRRLNPLLLRNSCITAINNISIHFSFSETIISPRHQRPYRRLSRSSANARERGGKKNHAPLNNLYLSHGLIYTRALIPMIDGIIRALSPSINSRTLHPPRAKSRDPRASKKQRKKPLFESSSSSAKTA